MALLRVECERCYGRSPKPEVSTTVNEGLQRLLERAFLSLGSVSRSLAAVALAADGRVLAAVGDFERKQPMASLLKPLSTAVALDHDLVDLRQRAATLDLEMSDTETERWLTRICQREARGDPTLEQALALSRNCEAVKVFAALGDSLRPEIARFGIPVPGGNPASALGLVETDLLQVARAYSSFVNGGSLAGIWAFDGCQGTSSQALSRETAAAIFTALQGTARFGTVAMTAGQWPDRHVPLAAKTGTADRVHTAVFLTHDVVVVIRLEAPDRLPGTAGRTAAPIGVRVLREWYGARQGERRVRRIGGVS